MVVFCKLFSEGIDQWHPLYLYCFLASNPVFLCLCFMVQKILFLNLSLYLVVITCCLVVQFGCSLVSLCIAPSLQFPFGICKAILALNIKRQTRRQLLYMVVIIRWFHNYYIQVFSILIQQCGGLKTIKTLKLFPMSKHCKNTDGKEQTLQLKFARQLSNFFCSPNIFLLLFFH